MAALAVTTEHTPATPSWLCACCGDPWPCPPARDAALVDRAGSLIAVTLAMAVPMTAALRDLPHLPPQDVYRRFVGWVRAARAA
jgi:hypothetical protein